MGCAELQLTNETVDWIAKSATQSCPTSSSELDRCFPAVLQAGSDYFRRQKDDCLRSAGFVGRVWLDFGALGAGVS